MANNQELAEATFTSTQFNDAETSQGYFNGIFHPALLPADIDRMQSLYQNEMEWLQKSDYGNLATNGNHDGFYPQMEALNLTTVARHPNEPITASADNLQASTESIIFLNPMMPTVFEGLQCLEIISGVNHVGDYNLSLMTNESAISSTVSSISNKDDENEDSDVVFVGQYQNGKIVQEEKPRRGRKRGAGTPQRKNPTRKAQTNVKALLAESESIPRKVFNAVVRNPRKKREVVKMTSTRQSCRTTGAILYPPSPLKNKNFRDWPSDGMHESPFFNSETQTIEKFHFQRQIPNKCKPVMEPATQVMKAKPICSKRCSLSTHKNLNTILSYALEVKEFNKIASRKSANCQSAISCSRLKEMYDKVALENESNSMACGCLVADACLLYSLTNNCYPNLLIKYVGDYSDYFNSVQCGAKI